MLKTILDIIFPPVCLLCRGKAVVQGFCGTCAGLLEKNRISSPVCLICGIPFPYSKGDDHHCGDCLTQTVHFTAARSAFIYEGAVLDSIHRLKYSGDTAQAKPLASYAVKAMAGLPAPDIIMPVPLFPSKLKARGFNQSLLVAREIAAGTGTRLDYTSLKRSLDTRQQVGLAKDERKRNVAGAFAVSNGSALRGKRVLLVDDVMTTGATAAECSKALKKAGAEVFVLTLARAVKV